MTTHVKVNGKVVLEDQDTKPFVTLELSEEAAKALKYVLGRVSGCHEKSMRKYTQAIYDSLNVNTWPNGHILDGDLHFKK